MQLAFKLIWRFIKKLEKQLFLLTVACAAFGVLILYSLVVNSQTQTITSHSAGDGLYKTQFVAGILGLIIALVISLIDYKKLCKLWFLYLPVSVGLVLLTFTSLGIQREGADDQAWLDLGFMTLQPSEFLKIAFILSFSYHCYKTQDRFNKPLNVVFLMLHGMIPVGLIALQGDHGTALVFVVIFAAIIFMAGISIKYILPALAALPIAGYLVWQFVMQPHHKRRILVIFNPELDPLGVGNQQRQGRIALGSGQMYGKGLFGGEYSYVSEQQNDFIFAYVGQTLGFVGCAALILVFCYMCFRILRVGSYSKDKLGKFICIGAFAMFFTHIFMNIGMVLGVMPVIGVPLPFISAGGTAVLSMYIAMGLVFSVHAKGGKNSSIHYFG